ncbi:MAG: hypothetical protein ACPGQS_05015 [Bradymonadia bacterium]
MINLFRGVAMALCLLCAGVSFSQETKNEPSSVDTAYGKPATATVDPSVEQGLEELRYKHLWIAYGVIWLIVFLFMYRTYRVGTTNRDSLEALKTRLASLEGRDE